MTAVWKEQNISRLAMSKFVSFEISYWKESYSTVLQEIGWLSFLHCILDSFIRSRVVLGESIGYAVTCKIRETFRNGSETRQILLD